MTILPVLNRELARTARRGYEPWSRSLFAAGLTACVLGTFASWYSWENRHITNRVMALIVERSFLLAVMMHVVVVLEAVQKSAWCIAEEKDRRTLEFLLATRLSAGEIVMGKFVARMIAFAATLLAGVPVLLLLNRLGGVDGWLILLAYAGIGSTAVFLSALAIWISATARSSRQAVAMAMLCTCGWVSLPLIVGFILPRFGLRPPEWVMIGNGWLFRSSPLGLALKFPGLTASSGLVDAVALMCGHQAAGAVVCLLGAILQLRPACRAHSSGDEPALVATGILGRRRFRARPPVGDDPILWKERFTGRPRGLARALDLLIYGLMAAAIVYPTWFFGWPALAEVWHHGYASGATSAERPEFNLITRFFPGGGSGSPLDLARIDFNLFLRFFSAFLSFFLLIAATGFGVESIGSERTRKTWSSLIATPLSAREILGAKLLATFWRFRLGLGTLILLWTLGLITGAIHPLGFVLSLMTILASIGMMTTWGILCAIRAKDAARASSPSMMLGMLLLGSGALLILLPAGLNSVLVGSGCSPFVLWLSQLSYRDLRNAWQFPSYPHLSWIGIETGEGPLRVALAILIGIAAPAVAALSLWRYATAHFDRLVGRPWREKPSAQPARTERPELATP